MPGIARVLCVCACLWGVARGDPVPEDRLPEHPSDEAIVSAYASVFSVQGRPDLKGVSAPVAYATDRLRVLLGTDAGPFDLRAIRALDQKALLVLAFKAVAGGYVTGPANFNSACHFTADPSTGVLELYHNTAENTAVLTVMSTVLLAVLLVVLGRGHVFMDDAGEE